MRRALSALGPLLIAVLLVLGMEGAARLRDRILFGEWPRTPDQERYEDAQRLQAIVIPDSALIAVLRPRGVASAHGRSAGVNTLGYRGVEFDHPKPPGLFRILAIGGSTTFDVCVSSDDAAWPSRLQQQLVERFPGRGIEVVNGGHPGYTTDEMLRKLESTDLSLVEPGLVLAYLGLNDLQPSAAPGFRADYSVGHPDVQRRSLGFQSKPPGWLERSVLLYKIGKHLTRRYDDVPDTPRSNAPLPEAAAIYRRRIEEIARVAQEHGAACVFLTQPLRFGRSARPSVADSVAVSRWLPYLTIDGVITGMELYNQITREASAESGAGLIDIARELGPEPDDFADYCHWSDQGAAKMAAFVARSLPDSLFTKGAR